MARLSGGAGGEPEHYFDYVQDSAPVEPVEAETWYDTDDDEAKVFNGAEWQLTNLVSHTNLSDVGTDDHHARYSDSEAANAAPVQSVNGATGDVSVNRILGGDAFGISNSDADATWTPSNGNRWFVVEASTSIDGSSLGTVSLTLNYDDGTSTTFSGDSSPTLPHQNNGALVESIDATVSGYEDDHAKAWVMEIQR